MPFSASISLRNFRILTHRRPDFAFILTILFPKKRQVATISVNIPTKGTDWLRVHELLAYLFIANGRGNKCLLQLLYSGDVMEQTPDVNYMISTPKHVELSWKTKKTKTGWNTGTGWMAMACDSLADSLVGPNHLRYTFIQSSNIRKSVKCNETN